MTALADLSEMVNRMTGGNSGLPEHLFVWKDNRVGAAAAAATVAGRWTSLWQYNGIPSDGAAPGAVSNPDNTTAGALKQFDPTGGRQKWLVGGTGAASGSAGVLVLYDRLLHIGGLSGTTTTAQTVGGTLTRYTNGAGNQIWVEIYTAIGGTGTTATCSYTDEAGNSGQTSPAFSIGGAGLQEAQRIIPVSLASGDTGVQACANIDLVATTGTAGNLGVSIVHPLLTIPCAGVGSIRSLLAEQGPIEIVAGACLALAWFANGTTAPQAFPSFHFCER